jgi:hypothetical protein
VPESQKDKEERIWKLLKEEYTYREICKIEHCSPNEVSRVHKKKSSESTKPDIQIKNKSICSQVFECLLKKIPLPQIVTDLDIEPEKVINFHKEFLLFQNQDNLVVILGKNKEYGESILKLHDCLTTHNINIEQVFNKLDSEKKMTELTEENAYFEVTNFNLSESRNYWEGEYRKLNEKYKKLSSSFHKLKSSYQ